MTCQVKYSEGALSGTELQRHHLCFCPRSLLERDLGLLLSPMQQIQHGDPPPLGPCMLITFKGQRGIFLQLLICQDARRLLVLWECTFFSLYKPPRMEIEKVIANTLGFAFLFCFLERRSRDYYSLNPPASASRRCLALGLLQGCSIEFKHSGRLTVSSLCTFQLCFICCCFLFSQAVDQWYSSHCRAC